MAVLAPARPLNWDVRHRLQLRIISGTALILCAATSAVQIMGYTSTAFSALCLLLAPAWLLTRPARSELIFVGVAAVGFLAFVLSFTVNRLPYLDQRILQWPCFALYFIGIAVLAAGSLDRVFALTAGIAIGTCGYFLTAGIPELAQFSFAAYWKYAFAPWITVLAMFVLVALNASRTAQAGLLLCFAVISLSLNYRSHALTCIGAATVLLVARYGGQWSRLARSVGGAAVVRGFAWLMPVIARSGIGGQALADKVEMQESIGAPALLAGRTEPPLSLTAIAEKPWLGWGSANQISPDVFARAEDLALQWGFDPSVDLYYQWHLPNGDTSLHSNLLNAWAEGGVGAALLPFALLIGAVLMIVRHDRFGEWAGLAVVLATQACWDLLFSPASYNTLSTFAVLAVACATIHRPGLGTVTATDRDPTTVEAR